VNHERFVVGVALRGHPLFANRAGVATEGHPYNVSIKICVPE